MNVRSKRNLAQKGFYSDERGLVLPVIAGGMFVLIGAAALAIDTANFYALQGKLQSGADAAATAAARELPDQTKTLTGAKGYAAKNLATSDHGETLKDNDVAVGNWDATNKTFTAAATPINAVQVTLRRANANGNAASTYFANVLGFQSVDIVVSAVALKPTPSACVLALNPSKKNAIKINNGTLISNGCPVHANSTNTQALDVASGGVLQAEAISVTGGYSSSGIVSPTPDTGQPQIPDPFAFLTPPSYSGCDFTNTNLGAGTHTLSQGVYCGGIKASSGATVNFNPGVYIINGGSLSSTGIGSVLQGTGVTFYFVDKSTLSLTGQGDATLTAPSAGPYQSVLFYGDPTAGNGTKHKVTGNGTMAFDGALYFPSAELTAGGNGAAGSTKMTMVVADVINASGNGSLVIDPNDSTVPLPLGVAKSRLVM
jgi:hypothetical protein